MNRTLRIFLFVLLLSSPCFAQTVPAWEVFGGYSRQKSRVREYFKTTPIIYAIRNQTENLSGFDVAVTENINRWFGGTLDVREHYAKPAISGIVTRERMFSVMYGPKFSIRVGGFPVIPFVQVLLGGTHMDAKVTPTGPHVSVKAFAAAAGAGVDVRLGSRIGVRAIQAEFLHANTLGANQNNFRMSAGVILYVGK